MVKSLMKENQHKNGSVNDQEIAWSVASNVLDPEIPCVTIGELGILRDLKRGTEEGGPLDWGHCIH